MINLMTAHHLLGHEVGGLQSPSPSPAPLPFYCFGHASSTIPGLPCNRAVDLPAFEDETDLKECRFGLGLHSTSYPFGDFHFGDEVPPWILTAHHMAFISWRRNR